MSVSPNIPAAIEITEPVLTARITTDALLGEIALDLYRLATNRKPVIPLPCTVIAEPTIAAAVLRDETRFAKEYRFLELLAQGRFTANGTEWRRRAALTQPMYTHAVNSLSEDAIETLYVTALRRRLDDAGRGLFECFVDGAVRVMSACLGLGEPLPWPDEAVAAARVALKIPLCVSLCGHATESADSVRESLATFFGLIEASWNARDDVRHLLGTLEDEARGIEGFNPVGELIQNVMAATETTASALMWCVECLARFPECRPLVYDDTSLGIDAFVNEVLRLFPPIPMVLRRCTEARDVEGLRVHADDVLGISFVGLHCHPDHWRSPLSFDPWRAEWSRPQAERPPFHPFSSGPRICGGARLALMEIRAGIRVFRRLFTTEEFKSPLAIDYSLTSRPHRRIDAVVRPAD